MRAAFRWGLLTAVLAPSLPLVARAEDSVLEREAQARFEEGVARVKAGNIEGARMSFAQAYAVVHKPTILWNLALAEEKSGYALEALAHFKELARVAQGGTDDRGNAEKHIGALMAQTGHLDVLAPVGTPLFVDGAAVATAPFTDALDVAPGRHHLQVQLTRGSREADVEVGPGQLLHVSLMPPAEVAPSPSAGEGNAVPRTVGTPKENAEGTSSSATKTVTVVLVAAAAAASMAAAAYFVIQAQSDQSTAQGFRQQYGKFQCFQVTSPLCTQWNDAVQAQRRDATLSDVFWVAAGAFAVGAAAAWLFWPDDARGGTSAAGPGHSRLATLRLTPTLGPAGAGFLVTGHF